MEEHKMKRKMVIIALFIVLLLEVPCNAVTNLITTNTETNLEEAIWHYEPIENMTTLQSFVIIFSIGISGIYGSILKWKEKKKKWKGMLIYDGIALILFILVFRDTVMVSLLWGLNVVIVFCETMFGGKKKEKRENQE